MNANHTTQPNMETDASQIMQMNKNAFHINRHVRLTPLKSINRVRRGDVCYIVPAGYYYWDDEAGRARKDTYLALHVAAAAGPVSSGAVTFQGGISKSMFECLGFSENNEPLEPCHVILSHEDIPVGHAIRIDYRYQMPHWSSPDTACRSFPCAFDLTTLLRINIHSMRESMQRNGKPSDICDGIVLSGCSDLFMRLTRGVLWTKLLLYGSVYRSNIYREKKRAVRPLTPHDIEFAGNIVGFTRNIIGWKFERDKLNAVPDVWFKHAMLVRDMLRKAGYKSTRELEWEELRRQAKEELQRGKEMTGR